MKFSSLSCLFSCFLQRTNGVHLNIFMTTLDPCASVVAQFLFPIYFELQDYALILVLPFDLRLCVQIGICPAGFSTNTSYVCIISLRATCRVYAILLDSKTVVRSMWKRANYGASCSGNRSVLLPLSHFHSLLLWSDCVPERAAGSCLLVVAVLWVDTPKFTPCCLRREHDRCHPSFFGGGGKILGCVPGGTPQFQ
jgi:hypothetical protein